MQATLSVNGLSFAMVPVDAPEAQLLLAELNTVLQRMLGHNGTAHVAYDDFSREKAFFMVGYAEGQPVCCAGLRRYDDITGEVKRVYARNGRGWGASLMRAVEQAAAALGYQRLVLECREANAHAIAFYERIGFTRCANYPPYEDQADAVCLEKALTGEEESAFLITAADP